MPRFFVQSDNICGNAVTINGSDAMHIKKSLRMKPGETIVVCDMHSCEHLCEICSFEGDAVILEVIESNPCDCEPPYKIKLFQAMPKNDKMDVIVQKSVECGACEIVPFISERCISRPDGKPLANKLERWNKIALEAAKQCGRGIIPEVRNMCTFKEAVEAMKKSSLSVLFYEGDGTVSLKKILINAQNGLVPGDEIAVMIGSEGGFAKDEVEFAANDGKIKLAGLGKRILRCETAPVFALSAIAYAFEL